MASPEIDHLYFLHLTFLTDVMLRSITIVTKPKTIDFHEFHWKMRHGQASIIRLTAPFRVFYAFLSVWSVGSIYFFEPLNLRGFRALHCVISFTESRDCS